MRNGRGELTDDEFQKSVIVECAKTYFRNVAKQKGARDDQLKYDKVIQEG